MFGGRKSYTADEVIKMLGDMTEEDRKKLRDAIKDGDDTTEKQIDKAAEDIADDKKVSKQTVRDRIDESVAAQERADGNQDSQTAKDRVDESLGEQRAKDEAHEKHMAGLEERIRMLEERFDKYERSPREVGDDKAKQLDDVRRIFTNN